MQVRAIFQAAINCIREGVGRLMSLTVEGGRKTNPEINRGICGEHGGEPASIALSAC